MQERTFTFQLHTLPSLSEEHLWTATDLQERKTEEQILQEVLSLEYHELTDTFFKEDAKEISHYSYNHMINLKDRMSPLFGKVYTMSRVKFHALKNYLDKMLGKGLICLLAFTARALALFSKKKDSLLCLCNYCRLNKITKKNYYLLLLISDLVDRLCSAKVYIKN